MTTEYYVECSSPKKRWDGPMTRSAANRMAREWRQEGHSRVRTRRGPGPHQRAHDAWAEQTRPEREASAQRMLDSCWDRG